MFDAGIMLGAARQWGNLPGRFRFSWSHRERADKAPISSFGKRLTYRRTACAAA